MEYILKEIMPLNETRIRTPLDRVSSPSDNQLKIPDNTKTPEYVHSVSKLRYVYDVRNKPVLYASRERLDRLGESMERTIIFPENEQNVRAKIDEILKWPEWIGGNIDLAVGDKFVWNKESGVMTLVSAVGQLKFAIRLVPETLEESQKNTQLALDMQDGYQQGNVEHNRESLRSSGKVLGDWIVRRGPWPGRNNSCGASVGSLLNQFGFRKILPQSGRDGKNWDTIIERHASEYFTKIPISHPHDAPAGSILVFNGNTQLWSSVRRKYGHVEIKWSDGMFYSYYKSVNAAGSSRTSERDPEKYKRLTGFTGYAYVYNGKKPPR